MSEHKEKQNIWNVPNLLTMIRMLLLPVYWVIFLRGYIWHALGVFVIASLTDIADGKIARKYNLITDFGKLMDPLADKLMVVSVMLSWVIAGVMPLPAMIILLGKELLMVLGGMFLLKKGVVVYAEKIGKYAQVLMVSSLILCFFHAFFESISVPVHLIVVWCAVALTLCALGFYARRAVERYRKEVLNK